MLRSLDKILLFYCCAFGFLGQLRAQQIQLNTPFITVRSVVNPAYLGELELDQIDFFMGTKQKWQNVPGAPQVDVLQLNKKWTKRNSVGFNFVRHSFATYKYNSFNIPYCFDAKINDASTLRLGLTTRFINSNIDFTESVTENPIEPAVGNYRPNTWFLDATAGFAFFYKTRVKFGGAINNFVVNGSINGSDLLDYNNYSVFQGLFDCSVNMVEKDKLTVSADYIRYITRITPAISEFYIRSRLDFEELRLTVGVGYKSTSDFVTFTKINYKGNYLIVTTQMNNSDNQLGYFSGNFFGIGMTLDPVERKQK